MPARFLNSPHYPQTVAPSFPIAASARSPGRGLQQGRALEGDRFERRARIPEQCAVAGFGDFPFSEKLTPALTTIRVPRYDIGCLAAQAILLRLGELEEGSAPLAPEPLPYELIARASA